MFLVPFQKKGWKIDHHVSNLRTRGFLFSRGSDPPKTLIKKKVQVGCNNGGGGANFWKVQRLVAKCIGTQKRLYLVFLFALVGFKKRSNFFKGHIVPINQNKYLPMFTGSWNMQEH